MNSTIRLKLDVGNNTDSESHHFRGTSAGWRMSRVDCQASQITTSMLEVKERL
jgi:hypothetical protein